MNLIEKYLKAIQSEYGYANPIQTRPKPKPGITGEDPEKPLPPGAVGPSGSQVDLEKDKPSGYDITNFSKADYGGIGDDKKKSKKHH